MAQRRFIGEDIADIKWVFNDAFLVVVTVSNKLFLLDSLCNAFSLILPTFSDTASAPSKVLRLRPQKSIGAAPTKEQ